MANNWQDGSRGFYGYGCTRLEPSQGSWIASIGSWCGLGGSSFRKALSTKRACLEKSNAAQAERLATLGEVQAEVSHEIKNPLSAMLLQAQIMQRNGGDAKAMEFAHRIEISVKRIQKIIDGVQILTRNSEADPFESVSIGTVIDHAAEISKWTLSSKRIPLLVNAAASNATVRCRPAQICQVLINLIHNARDAVENLHEPWIRINAEERSDSISLSVTDSGNGISAEVQKKLMEPYFTTKPAGKGTGLGLAISRKIAETHGGSLFLDTKALHTCFRLELPKFCAIPV